MVDETQYLTQEGIDTINKRLNYLTNVRRPEMAERLRQALEDGGELTENTEYEEAKNEQALVESEITRLNYILRNAKVIDENATFDSVQIGAVVTIIEDGYDDEEEYRIVGAAEANPSQGKISKDSPLGNALMGAKVGDKVKYKAPDGTISVKVKAIS